jgi:hypothetical protein
MDRDDVFPFRLAREIVPKPLRRNRVRWMKVAVYASPALAALGTAIAVTAGLLLCSAIGQERILESQPALLTLGLISFVAFTSMTMIAMKRLPRAIDRELRRSLPTVKLEELLPRRPILLLRCFLDDELVSPGEISGPTALHRVEERIVAAAEGVAPVVALGRPGEELPHTGAHRFYVVHEDWQDAVGFLLSRCRYVIVIYHAGPSVQWEVGRAFEIVPLDRLIFILPMPKRGFRFLQWLSGESRGDRARLSHASETFRHYTGHPLPDLSKRTEIVVFRHGAASFLDRQHSTVFKRSVWIYRALVVMLVLVTVAVIVGEKLHRGAILHTGDGFVATLVSSNSLVMSATSLIVISMMILEVMEKSRFGSYIEMLKKYFGQD